MRLPPGAYSAERGLNDGGMNKDPTPDLGTGGRNVDVALGEGRVDDGVGNGVGVDSGPVVHVELDVVTDAECGSVVDSSTQERSVGSTEGRCSDTAPLVKKPNGDGGLNAEGLPAGEGIHGEVSDGGRKAFPALPSEEESGTPFVRLAIAPLRSLLATAAR